MSISLQQAFAQLRSMVSNPTLNQLIKEMIVVGQDKNSDLHSFYQICTNWISTPGFRPGSKAPLPMLLKGCMEIISKQTAPFVYFLLFLPKLDPEPVREIQRIIAADFSENPWVLPESTDDYVRYINAIRDRVEETVQKDWGEERLALTIGSLLALPLGSLQGKQLEKLQEILEELLDRLQEEPQEELQEQPQEEPQEQPQEELQEEPQEEPQDAPGDIEKQTMDLVLEDLASVPADDPFWSRIDEFVAAVQDLHTLKMGARETQERIRAALCQMHSECGQHLQDYFQTSLAPWRPENIIPGKENFVLESLPELEALLLHHKDLSQETPKTLVERRELHEKLSGVEEEIMTRYDLLSACFDQPDPETDAQPADSQKDETEGAEDDQASKDVLTPPAEKEPETVSCDEREAKSERSKEKPQKQIHKPRKTRRTAVDRGQKQQSKAEPDPQETLEQHDPVLEMIEVGDLAGAYWRAKALEQSNLESSVPSPLILAMQGSRYLLRPGFGLASGFTYPLKYDYQGQGRFIELAALGVGLIGTVFVPNSGSFGWLFDQEQLPNLQKTISVIREFSYRGIALSKRDLLMISNRDEHEKAVKDAARKCQNVINTYVERRFGFPAVNKIWNKVFGEKSSLRLALEKVGADCREEIDEIRGVLDTWSTRDHIEEHIQSLSDQVLPRRERSLSANEHGRIVRSVNEVVEATGDWITLVDSARSGSDARKQQPIEQLIGDLKSCLAPTLSELDETRNSSRGAEAVGLRFIGANLQLLLDYINGSDLGGETSDIWSWQDSNTIEEVLAKRLLRYPELELLDNGLPTGSDWDLLLACLKEPNQTWHQLESDIFHAWLDKQDYRFFEVILAGLDVEETTRDDLRTTAVRQLQGSRDTLDLHCQQTVENVERALVNGVISEEERVELLVLVESIDPLTALHFPRKFSTLRRVDRELSAAADRRIDHLKGIWQDYSPRLEEIATPEEASAFQDFVKGAINERDTRVVDEYLAKVREHLEKKQELRFGEWRHQSRDYLGEFFSFRQALEKNGKGQLGSARTAMSERKSWMTLNYGGIPPEQLNQAISAVDAWTNLAKRDEALFGQSIIDLFTYLGFTISTPVEEKLYSSASSNFLHLPLKMEASEQARPFPHFGSLARPAFNVLMVWERSGADNIVSAIYRAKLGAQSTILLYFGRLAESVRKHITYMTRQGRLPMAILDEALLLFLTGERDARLGAFLRSSVPYGTLIPYTPRNVPPEIFYGREGAVQELQRKDGSCLIYGGRQMGKSALLRQVRRQAHNPKRHQYAWVEDVKTLGDSYSHEKPSRIWTRFWGLLSDQGLVSERPASDDQIITAIGCLLRKEQDLQIILMLDEADGFLNQDALDGFRTVTTLRRLMTDSDHRFKVIFAGLQHVQRFQSLPNQPLAHFGTPILVGPLEVRAATALVREPLQALGFQLDDSCVYRILSFTNYHPGLIQVFCYHLLERLYAKNPVFPIPHKPLPITKEDVDSIYMQEEVRDGIRERFEWTLALDQRYQVITWAMIVAQAQDRDSFGREFSVAELFGLTREYWLAEFETMTNDEFRGLLQELSGLGVLIKGQGKYRLKSPNLVRLLGTEEDILNRLYEFVDKPARVEAEPDGFHHLINAKGQVYSAFTFEQARNIDLRNDFRVVIVSQALGFEHIEESIKSLYSDQKKTGVRRVKVGVDTAASMNKFIEKECVRAKKRDYDNLVLYQIVDKVEANPFEAICAAWEFFQRSVSSKNPDGVSFFFVLNPPVYWHALRLVPEFLEELNSQGAMMRVKTWNAWGIGQRLDGLDKLNNDQIRKTMLEISGGWPWLLNEIISRCGSDDNSQKGAKQIETLLHTDDEFRQSFLRQLELPEDNSLSVVLHFLVKNPKCPVELIGPELIEPPMGLTLEQCTRALDFLQQFSLVRILGDAVVVNPTIQKVFSA